MGRMVRKKYFAENIFAKNIFAKNIFAKYIFVQNIFFNFGSDPAYFLHTFLNVVKKTQPGP